MEIINGGRGSGRTVRLIYITAETGRPILTPTRRLADFIKAEARKLGVEIPPVLTFSEAKAMAKRFDADRTREEINRRGGYLIDNADELFEMLLEEKLRTQIAAITICQPVTIGILETDEKLKPKETICWDCVHSSASVTDDFADCICKVKGGMVGGVTECKYHQDGKERSESLAGYKAGKALGEGLEKGIQEIDKDLADRVARRTEEKLRSTGQKTVIF